MTFDEYLFVAVVAALTCALALLFLSWQPHPVVAEVANPPEPLSLLFDSEILHHGTGRALDDFALQPGVHDWQDFRETLLSRFSNLPETLEHFGSGSRSFAADNPKDVGLVKIRWRDNLTWVDVVTPKYSDQGKIGQNDRQQAQKLCCEFLPYPAWMIDSETNVIWQNPAFDTLANQLKKKPDHALLGALSDCRSQRISIAPPDGQTMWFDVTRSHSTDKSFFLAIDVTSQMHNAETQRNFQQTLTKTFAHLPIGLAVFDNEGRLRLFNPALVNLSGLSPEFLAAKPTALSFFDQLRETRRMPEPKNYKTWRNDVNELVAAASDGDYQETWSLDEGRTYAVQGRPHPDGGVAFFFEDISSEIALSRNFRSEIEQFEAVLNQIDDAIAVFSQLGLMTYCNRSYQKLWGHDLGSAFADVTILDAVNIWKSKAGQNPAWQRLADVGLSLNNKESHTVQLDLDDGQLLRCQMARITHDAVQFRFSALENHLGEFVEDRQSA